MRLKSGIQLMYLTSMQRNIRLQTWVEYPGTWINYFDDLISYETLNGDINYREILNNEIVIDIDADYVDVAPKHADLVQQDLYKKRMYYSRWLSGGNGIHFHLFFDPKEMVPLVKKYGYTTVKETFLHYLISSENINPKGLDSHICFGHNRLICLEYSRHKKGKDKTLIKDAGSKMFNRVPQILIDRLKKSKEQFDKGSKRFKEIIKTNGNYSFPCEKFVFGDVINNINVFELKDGLYRLLFLYVSFLIKKGTDHEKIFEETVIWRNKFNASWLNQSKHKVTDKHIKYMIRECRGEIGCRSISSSLSEIGAKKICDTCIFKRG